MLLSSLVPSVALADCQAESAQLWQEGFPAPGTAHDRSAALLPLLSDEGQAKRTEVEALLAPLKEELSELTVLVVPGFLTDSLEILRNLGLSDYLDGQEAGAAQVVREVIRVDLNSEASSKTNAMTIADAVAGTEGPLCLITHSKGGLDSLTYLLQAEPAERARFSCWITFQAPFAGAPLADVTAEWWLPRETSEALLDAVGGEAQTLGDMTSNNNCYTAERLEALQALNEEIPILSVAGLLSADDDLEDHVSINLPVLLWMRGVGIPSDGLVPLGSAILPFSDYVTFHGTDHTALVSGGPLGRSLEDRALITQALLAIALTAPASNETIH